MRAQDRDAVRTLLAAQERDRGAPEAAPAATKKPKKKRPDKWWTSSMEVDPISLEPIAELAYVRRADLRF